MDSNGGGSADVVVNPACGSWWAAPKGWQYGDAPVESTYAGNSTYDVAAIEARCGGCFIFHMHNSLNCDVGVISFLSQTGSFDAMAFAASMVLIMAVVAQARNQAGRMRDHAILPHLAPSSCGRKAWRAWAFHIAVLAVTVNVLRAKVIFSFGSPIAARRTNVVISAYADTLMAVLLVLLQGAWFWHHTDPRRGMVGVYNGPRRPPVFLRLLSVLGFVCDSPTCSTPISLDVVAEDDAVAVAREDSGISTAAARLRGCTWRSFRIHLHQGRAKAATSIMLVVLLSTWGIYPVAALYFAANAPVEIENGQRLIVPRNEGVIDFWMVSYFLYQVSVALAFADAVLAQLAYVSFGFGRLLPSRDKSRTARRRTIASAVALTDATRQWLESLGVSVDKARVAIPGRLCPESALEHSWLVAICSSFPVAKAVVGLAIASGNLCPYTSSESDPRGDPYEEPWMDVWNLMQMLALLLLFTFDSFPRKLTTSIVNFTQGAAIVRTSAVNFTRAVSTVFAVAYAFHNRFIKRSENSELLDELLYVVGFFVTMAVLGDVRVGVVAVLPWHSKTRQRFRASWSRFIGSCSVVFVLLWLGAFWGITFFVSPATLNKWRSSSTGTDINFGTVFWPVAVLLVTRVVVSLLRPPVKRSQIATSVLPVEAVVADADDSDSMAPTAIAPLSRWQVLDDMTKIVSITVAAWVLWSLVLSTLALLVVYVAAIYVAGLVCSHVIRDDAVTDVHHEPNDPATVEVELTAVGGSEPRPEVDDDASEDAPSAQKQHSVQSRCKSRSMVCAAEIAVVLILFAVSHLAYLSSTVKPLRQYRDRPLIIGHRGVWKSGVPESSKQAADVAKAAGFDGVEFDVRLSADGVPVLMHDETLERTTNGTGNVWDYTLEELRQLTLLDSDPDRHETVYTLDEYMEYLVELDMIAEIELKQGNDGSIVPMSIDSVCRANWTEKSFMATAEQKYQVRLRCLRTVDDDSLIADALAQNLLWTMAPGMSVYVVCSICLCELTTISHTTPGKRTSSIIFQRWRSVFHRIPTSSALLLNVSGAKFRHQPVVGDR